MSSKGWKMAKLKDLCSKIGSGATPRGGKEVYLHKGKYSLIRSQNVLDFTFSCDGLAFINKDQANQLDNVAIQERDVLLNITGDSVARSCQVPKEVLPARVNQHVAILRPDETKLLPEFLKYFLLNPSFKSFMLSLASVGGTRNALTKGMIEEFEIYLPPLPTQHRIAAILSALDDKIELNRRMNQTLEAMAQAIFREWFVRFNFPGATGEMVETELGEVPKGWRVVRLEEFIEIKHGFAFKGEFFSSEETDNILLTPGNFLIGGGFNYSKLKYYSGEVPTDYILHYGDLIVTMTDLSKEGDTLGYSAIVPTIQNKRLLHNQRIGKVILKEQSSGLQYFFYWLMRQNDYRNFVLSGATGTTVRHTSPSRICEFEFLLPEDLTIQDFYKAFSPLQRQIEENIFQSQTLIQLRDRLLSKLMRGEINVD